MLRGRPGRAGPQETSLLPSPRKQLRPGFNIWQEIPEPSGNSKGELGGGGGAEGEGAEDREKRKGCFKGKEENGDKGKRELRGSVSREGKARVG